jgi:hypothetical protein
VLSSLLTEDHPGRYWFHDLLRVYAAEQALARESAGNIPPLARRGRWRW